MIKKTLKTQILRQLDWDGYVYKWEDTDDWYDDAVAELDPNGQFSQARLVEQITDTELNKTITKLLRHAYVAFNPDRKPKNFIREIYFAEGLII